MTITQYDSIDPSQIPSNPEAVAGYVGGWWPDYSRLVSMFPHARHKSVCVNAGEDGDILDVENGDATPQQAPGWYRRQKSRGVDVVGLYADESTMPEVVSIMSAAGIPMSDYVRWVAWLGATDIPSGDQARQYTFRALGRDLDASVCLPEFWGTTPPPVRNTMHYERFPTGPTLVNKVKLDPRSVVKRYDKYRAQQTKTSHPHRVQLAILRKYLGWLAGRVDSIAHSQPRSNGKPSWNLDYRGWQYQHLIHRAQGQRFV